MRTINCLLCPIPNEEGHLVMIQFPICTKSIAELAEVKNAEIVALIGTHNDPFCLKGAIPNHKQNQIVDTILVKSFETAVDYYGIISEGMSGSYK